MNTAIKMQFRNAVEINVISISGPNVPTEIELKMGQLIKTHFSH